MRGKQYSEATNENFIQLKKTQDSENYNESKASLKKKSILRYIKVKLQNTKDKEEIIKVDRDEKVPPKG